MNDSISDFFTRLRNASFAGHSKVHVPWTKVNERFVQILLQHGFVLSYQSHKTHITVQFRLKPLSKAKVRQIPIPILGKEAHQNQRPIITQIQRLSRPSCRIYIQSKQIPTFLRNSLGNPILFLSTSRGILSDREARAFNVGGEVLGIVS